MAFDFDSPPTFDQSFPAEQNTPRRRRPALRPSRWRRGGRGTGTVVLIVAAWLGSLALAAGLAADRIPNPLSKKTAARPVTTTVPNQSNIYTTTTIGPPDMQYPMNHVGQSPAGYVYATRCSLGDSSYTWNGTRYMAVNLIADNRTSQAQLFSGTVVFMGSDPPGSEHSHSITQVGNATYGIVVSARQRSPEVQVIMPHPAGTDPQDCLVAPGMSAPWVKSAK